MVRLKAYRCHNCSLICETSEDKWAGICMDCGKLTCGPCITLREAEKAKCTVTQKNCVYTVNYTGYLHYIHKFAPDDELKLLNYGKWCPIRCSNYSCVSSFATQRIGYIGGGMRMLCTKCLPAGTTGKQPPINTYMRIVDELRGYFSDQECIVTTRKKMQHEHFKCQLCKARLDCYNFDGYFTNTGELMCTSCKGKSSAYHPRRRISCIYWLAVLLDYIPDIDDLKLLTYSKWTPLRCELCSTPFSPNFLRTPTFHPACSKLMCTQCLSKHTCSETNTTSIRLRWILDVDKELRSLFKNGGDDPPATPFRQVEADERQKKVLCLPSSYDFDVRFAAMTVIPQQIRCDECTEWNVPTKLRVCVDCKKLCLCLLCLTKEHWGHHIDELETSLQSTYIQKESEKTLEKLANWTDSVTEGYRQIHVGCGKVVDNYNWLYTKAIRETDLALLHTIRERSNIGQLKTSIDRLIGAQIMVRSSVEELEKSLSDIVTEEKTVCAENHVASNAAGASTSK